MHSLFLFCLLSLSISLVVVCSTTTYVVTNCSNTVSTDAEVDTKCYHLENISEVISNHSVIKFLSRNISLHHLIKVSHIDTLTLIGDSEIGFTSIQCNSSASGLHFTNVNNLVVKNLKFEGCGANPDFILHGNTSSSDSGNVKFTLYLQDCTNVSLIDVHVKNGNSIGMAMFDTFGIVTVENCTFSNNRVRSNHLPGGGGVYIEITHAPLYYSDHSHSAQDSNNVYNFKYCKFLNNNSSVSLDEEADYLSINRKMDFGKGGGLSIYFKGNATNNLVNIIHCNFSFNTAIWGGGLKAGFQGNCSENFIMVENSHFAHNKCSKRTGGAADITFYMKTHSQTAQNRILFHNVLFFHNEAIVGGGVSVFSTFRTVTIGNEVVEFVNCTWKENTAVFGSAIDLSLQAIEDIAFHQFLSPYFEDCKFVNNVVLIRTDENEPNNVHRGRGAFQSNGFSLQFKGTQLFVNNNGSAMHLTSSVLNFFPGSRVDYQRNFGIFGGAIYLIGHSVINVHDNSLFRFVNNTALSRGSALYYFSFDNHNFISKRTCFISYKGAKDPSERNVTFLFDENKLLQDLYPPEQSIFASSLQSCNKSCNSKSVKLFSCVGNFTFTNANPNTNVATLGSQFYNTSKLPILAIPGKKTLLPIKFRDDFGQTVQARCSISDSVHNESIFIDSKKLEYVFYGSPGDNLRVYIETIGFREVMYSFPVVLTECPPGFVMDTFQSKAMCICSSDTKNKRYLGIYNCKHKKFEAYIKRGYWAGYKPNVTVTEESLQTAYCPFCLYNESRILLNGEASRQQLEKRMCVGNRTGTLCGKCKENYTLHFHYSNISYACYLYSEEICKYGPLLYIISELVPVTILFIIVLVFNISFTAGAVNGFILFAQLIVNMHLNADKLIETPHDTQNFLIIVNLIYKMFNLDFFSHQSLSFCLWKDAEFLDLLAMKYVTIMYSFILILITTFFMRICNSRKFVACKVKNFKKKNGNAVKGSIIHGLSSFLVMCYAQCALVSVLMLTAGTIDNRIDFSLTNKTRRVVLYSGHVDYFGTTHLRYAIPAMCFLASIVLAPPVLLIVYPLCYKLFKLLKIKEKNVSLICKLFPFEKLKPLFDSFQGCFKDEHRYFAGLYFLYRLAIPATFALTQTFWFYVYVELILIFILSVHSICQPYKNKWHNRLDSCVFFILAVINGLTLSNHQNSSVGCDHDQYAYNRDQIIEVCSLIQAILIVIPLIYIILYAIVQLCIRIFHSLTKRRKRGISNITDSASFDISLLDRRQLDESSDTFVTSYDLKLE